MKKKKLFFILVIITFILSCYFLIIEIVARWDVIQGNPLDDPPWGSVQSYQFSPATILDDLEREKTDIFTLNEELLGIAELEARAEGKDTAQLGTFAWSQEDFLKISRAHHLFLTGETVDIGWELFRYLHFKTSSGCSTEIEGFEYGQISYYKVEDDKFPVTFMSIHLNYFEIKSAYTYYPKEQSIPARIYYPAKMDISAEEALQIAENAGGRLLRTPFVSAQNCNISIRVYYFGGNEWHINYYHYNDSERRGRELFDIDVNVKNGDYEILFPRVE